MSEIVKKESLRWWVSPSQELTEGVYMLRELGRHFGRDERYWKHHRGHLKVINQMDISENLVLPFIHSVNGVRTVILIEFDMPKTENVAPIMIDSIKENGMIAMLEIKESD